MTGLAATGTAIDATATGESPETRSDGIDGNIEIAAGAGAEKDGASESGSDHPGGAAIPERDTYGRSR